LEAGAALVVSREHSQTTAIARGGIAQYGFDFRPTRWDAGFVLDHYVRLADAWKLHVGGFYELNEVDIDRPSYAGGYVQFSRNAAETDSFFRVRSMETGYGNAVGTVLQSGFLSEVDRSFTNVKTEASTGLLVGKNRTLAPFFEVGAANIEFTHQTSSAVLDRNAHEAYGIVGVRWTISPQLRIDLGVRGNERELNGSITSSGGSYSSGYFDGKIVWAPNDRFFVELNLDRKNADPLSANALFTERTAAEFHATSKLTERISAEMSGGLVKHDQIGLTQHFDERFLHGRVSYKLSDRAVLFSIVKSEAVKDSVTDLTSHRLRVGAGVKVGF
jgi:hypothetical protein